MKKPALPEDENARIKALNDLDILDTPAESRFDRIVRIAKSHFNVSISLVSIVDQDRQWFKARLGLDAQETSREISFCGHAILGEDIFYVPNAVEDSRFVDNPLVTGEPKIRFYAGAPLHSPDGFRLGTLCIIDNRALEFTEEQLSVLRDLADLVESELSRTHLLESALEYRAQKQRLDHLIQMSPGVLYARRANGDLDISYVSEKVADILGYNSHQFTDNTTFWLDHIHPDDRLSVTSNIEQLFTSGNSVIEYRFLHSDESYHWMSDHLHLVFDEDNNPQEIIGLWMDIDHQKRLEEAWKSNEVRIRAIVDTIIDGIIVVNSKGVIQTFNPAAEFLFGYQSEEVIGKNISQLMPEPFRSAHDSYVQNYLNSGISKVLGNSREVAGQRKDGSTFAMELTVSEMAIKGEVMFTGIVRDISERKAATEELNRFKHTLDNTLDMIFMFDEETMRFNYLNAGAIQSMGYSQDELLGMHPYDIKPDFTKEVFLHFIAPLISGEQQVLHFETVHRKKSGEDFPVEIFLQLIPGESSSGRFIAIVRDITERKKVDKMKSEFISTVSHELRTPLTSIRGAVGLVLGNSSDQLSEKNKQMLEMAKRNSERLTLLINDILDLEKIQSGQLKFDFQNIDLIDLARQSLDDNEGYARNHDVSLELSSSLKNANVFADPHRILQVFANLISNAVKYSPKKDKVLLTISEQTENFRVSVKDFGEGIPHEFRTQIFQRFAQADSSSTREKSGTGLGLSISKLIIEQHGGAIDYESEIGEGTMFYFDLPSFKLATPNVIKNPDKAKVLICENVVEIASTLKDIVEELGYLCDIATTAKDADNLIEKHDYGLLLLDLNMPDMDGIRFLQHLRNQPKTESLPIVVVSGREEDGVTRFEGDALTILDWLQKPVDTERLKLAVRKAILHTVRPSILHVEDDPDIVEVTQLLLESVADLTHTVRLSEAKEILSKQDFDLVILDIGLPDGSGLNLLDELKGRCPVVIFSAQIPDKETSAQVSAALTKSVTSNERLLATIKKLLSK